MLFPLVPQRGLRRLFCVVHCASNAPLLWSQLDRFQSKEADPESLLHAINLATAWVLSARVALTRKMSST